MFVAGNGIYGWCADCGQLVKINKWLFGSLHSCLTEEEIKAKAHQRPLGGSITPQDIFEGQAQQGFLDGLTAPSGGQKKWRKP